MSPEVQKLFDEAKRLGLNPTGLVQVSVEALVGDRAEALSQVAEIQSDVWPGFIMLFDNGTSSVHGETLEEVGEHMRDPRFLLDEDEGEALTAG
jgi:hypothetical protein